MAEDIALYFPPVSENGGFSLFDLCDAHVQSLYASTKARTDTAEKYKNPFGKEIILQRKALKKNFTITASNLVEQYKAIEKEFSEKCAGKSLVEIGYLAIDAHKELVDKIYDAVFEKIKDREKTKNGFVALADFLRKDGKTFYKEFAERTAISMEDIINEILKTKKKEILKSSLEANEKNDISAFLEKTCNECIEKIGFERKGSSTKEIYDSEYIFDSSKEATDLRLYEEVQKFCRINILTCNLDSMIRKNFVAPKDPELLKSVLEKICIVSGYSINELKNASGGHFGFSTRKLVMHFANELEGLFPKGSLSAYDKEDFNKECRKKFVQLPRFMKTGETFPTFAEYRNLYGNFKKNAGDIKEFAKEIVLAIGKKTLAEKL